MRAFWEEAEPAQLPEGWTTYRLKDVAPFVNRGVAPDYADGPTTIRVFNQKCVRPDRTVDVSLGRYDRRAPTAENLERALLRAGDVVINSTGTGTLGRAALFVGADEHVIADGHVTVIRADRAKVSSPYLSYLLGTDSFYRYANEALAVGATNQTELNKERLRTLPIALPTVAVQEKLVSYLEVECEALDLMAEEQRRQKILLEEANQESARRLLTGADLAGARTEVGPYWLGPTPQSWEPQKIAWRFLTGSGTTPSSGEARYYDGGLHPWLNTGECRDKRVATTARLVTDAALEECSALKYYPPGSVVVAMYGATIGRLAMLDAPMTVNQACCVLHRPTTLDPWFTFYWLWAHRPQLVSMGEGGGQPNINQELVRQLRVPAPPLAEQQEIVRKIENVLTRNERIASEIDSQLHYIAEHRQALVTAAVTGQLDVNEEPA